MRQVLERLSTERVRLVPRRAQTLRRGEPGAAVVPVAGMDPRPRPPRRAGRRSARCSTGSTRSWPRRAGASTWPRTRACGPSCSPPCTPGCPSGRRCAGASTRRGPRLGPGPPAGAGRGASPAGAPPGRPGAPPGPRVPPTRTPARRSPCRAEATRERRHGDAPDGGGARWHLGHRSGRAPGAGHPAPAPGGAGGPRRRGPRGGGQGARRPWGPPT